MQQGYFDQCNDIISNLEETLSALQLTVSDLHAWAFGSGQSDDDSNPKKVAPYVPSRLMKNRLIDALEHATAILSDANEVQIFMMGGEYEGAQDDWKDDLAFTDSAEAQASPVKQAKPETIEAVEVARKIVGAQNVVVIGGHEVPAPMSCEPALKQVYYVPGDFSHRNHFASTWDGDKIDFERLRNGMCHATKEAAIAHAKALIAVSKGE
ncbi:MAG: hypothetical protein ACRDD9_23545 [Shewanella sp.]